VSIFVFLLGFLAFYISHPSQDMAARANSTLVNELTQAQVDRVIARLWERNHLKKHPKHADVVICTLKTAKYPQVDCAFLRDGHRKILVHQIMWRHQMRSLVPDNQEISHLTGNPLHVWPVVAERAKINDSRKACHDSDEELDFARKGLCPHSTKCIHVAD
jgi:hypothetical protein